MVDEPTRPQGGGITCKSPITGRTVCVQATQYVEFLRPDPFPVGGVDFAGLLQFDKGGRGIVLGIHTISISMLGILPGGDPLANAAFSIQRLSLRSYESPDNIIRDIHLAPPTRVAGVFIERFFPPWRIPQSLEKKTSMGLRFELNMSSEASSGILAVGLAVYEDGRWLS